MVLPGRGNRHEFHELTRITKKERNQMNAECGMRTGQKGLSLRAAGIWGLVIATAGIGVLGLCLVLSGCSSVPSRFDNALFTMTNVPMVTQRWTTNVVVQTNTVFVAREVVQTNTVTQTNSYPEGAIAGRPVVEVHYVYVTNTVQVAEQQLTRATNAIAPGSTVLVPQLAELKPSAQAGSGFISGIAGMFGYGGIASLALSGLAHGYQGYRNRRLAAAATGATAEAEALQQVAGGLTQNVETVMAVLQGSPQGQALLPLIKNYLMSHQRQLGTINQVGDLVKEYVDVPEAQQSAAVILGALRTLSGGLPGQGNPPGTATASARM